MIICRRNVISNGGKYFEEPSQFKCLIMRKLITMKKVVKKEMKKG